jgi:hypothetical protein
MSKSLTALLPQRQKENKPHKDFFEFLFFFPSLRRKFYGFVRLSGSAATIDSLADLRISKQNFYVISQRIQ